MFYIEELEINGLFLFTPKVLYDTRGYFYETYKKSLFSEYDIHTDFIQENFSFSHQGVLRGLHFQIGENAQDKLIQCISGKIFDVAVDLRKDSETFGKWISEILSEENKKMLYIPKGFAHGFYTLSENALVHYKVSSEYDPKTERGIIWNDPDLNIEWPTQNPILSEKDKNLPLLREIGLTKNIVETL